MIGSPRFQTMTCNWSLPKYIDYKYSIVRINWKKLTCRVCVRATFLHTLKYLHDIFHTPLWIIHSEAQVLTDWIWCETWKITNWPVCCVKGFCSTDGSPKSTGYAMTRAQCYDVWSLASDLYMNSGRGKQKNLFENQKYSNCCRWSDLYIWESL